MKEETCQNKLEIIMICVCEVFGETKKEILLRRTRPSKNIYDARRVFLKLANTYVQKYGIIRIAKWAGTYYSKIHDRINEANAAFDVDPEFRKKYIECERKYLENDFFPYNMDVIYTNC